ncbi:MAG TPA: hypothetical protein VK031_01845, partial [Tissierellaceae bacterium]|nr:hypothetical protein [Tissierellaceae bacterium]
MSKYLVFNIESLENLKFSSTNVQSDSEDTNEYIPGTSIRGAYIYRYMIKKDIKDINQGEHRDKLLNGKIKFLNAYPIYANKRGMPLPKVYFARKDELKSEQNKIDMYPGLGQDLGAGYGKVRACEFVGWEKDSFYRIKVDKISNLHINKMNNKEPNKLFMYEAIKAGQSFQGIIKVEDDEYIEEVREIFENTIVYLGGSKGSGYGKCQIGNISIMEENPELEYFDQSLKGQEIYLLALSDIIYRNEYGEYKTYIEEKDLEKELGLEKVEFIDSSIETKAITNFNNKWNCSTPIINGIKAGSVLKYRITEELNLDSIKKFMDKGIGERRIDG